MINQNKYQIKLCNIMKKKPKFVPNPAADHQQIKQIIFNTNSKDTEHLVNFIYRKIADPGLLATLSHKLYEMSEDGICFYIPQIVYLSLKRDCKSITQFLLDSARTKWQLYCLIYWSVQAFGFQMKDKSEELRNKLDAIQNNIERNFINSGYNIENVPQGIRDKYSKEEIAKIRYQHIRFFKKFINKIVTTSLNLKKIDESIRKTKLKETVVLANKSLRMWKQKNKQYGFIYHHGIPIPFRQQKNQLFSSNLMVNIIEDECSCFNTAKRVPYRIVLETIDQNDLKLYQKKNKKSQQSVNLSQNDTFLDDNQTQNRQSNKIIPDDPLKFLGLDQLAIAVVKNENQAKVKNDSFLSKFVLGMTHKEQNNDNNPLYPIIEINKSIKHSSVEKIQKVRTQRQLLIENNYKKYFEPLYFRTQKIKYRRSTGDACKLLDKKFLSRKQTIIFENARFAIQRPQFYSEREIDLTKVECFINKIPLQSIKDPIKLKKIKSIQNDFFKEESEQNNLWVNQQSNTKRNKGPWGELWIDKVKRFKANSSYSHFPSYKLRNVIVKGGDDLRQQIVCMQLIYKFRQIFENSNLDLYLRPYQIIVLNQSSGMLEFVTNSISIDGLKKSVQNFQHLLAFYSQTFAYDKLKQAQSKFCSSLAAYSLLTYLLQIKDRHNGNILIDNQGHIIHIDFGFIFSISPGDVNLETSPFKLTAQYIQMLGGQEGQLFQRFKDLFYEGFRQLRKHIDSICAIIQIMMEDSDLPCFKNFNIKVFRDRFKISLDDRKFRAYCQDLISESSYNTRTIVYDYYQYKKHDIRQ